MTWQIPDTSYWNDKFAAWWHDPIDKVFNIKGHENWAADYLNVFGLQRPNEEFWKVADAVAAGFERGQLPSYHQDELKSGAVDFGARPVITHPISGKNGVLKIEGNFHTPDQIHADAIDYLKKTIGTVTGESDLASLFKGREDYFAEARMLFTHLVLRFLLAQENISGLGALWHRIPADSRFPDHSIWQHNALCSAISSCMGAAAKTENVGLMVFSITPVQSFIGQARKLRDFWTGSVILSWLAFEGIRWVIENLGPDHIIYPSLIDQPMIGIYLEKKRKFKRDFLPNLWIKHPKEIASFPNKFVSLVPIDRIDGIASEIEDTIRGSWREMAEFICDFVSKDHNDDEKKHLKDLFDRQTRNTWDLRWAATRLLSMDNLKDINDLLHKSNWESQKEYFNKIKGVIKPEYQANASRNVFYSTSHSLVQSALAAEKSARRVSREPEPGEKCQMCGEFEVLHAIPWKEGEKAERYKQNVKEFWSRWRGEEQEDVDIKENERLCSVCMIKRFLPRVMKMKKHEQHLLSDVFDAVERFPSTTEMALFDYFNRNNIKDEKEKREIAQTLHKDEEVIKGEKASKEKRLKNRDKYYAVLLMDGDRMGDLVNGKTIAALWKDILHPDIRERIDQPGFLQGYAALWKAVSADAKTYRRLVTPAIHAAISEALSDFAMYGVAGIIAKHGGRLVYAGGDDVFAFLPISRVLDAATEIRKYYISVFRQIDDDGESRPLDLKEKWKIQPGKLSVNLGEGDGISISSSILICHHKESLTQMIRRAHTLLDKVAKSQIGRNACALELRKRHGGERLLAAKWDDPVWEALKNLGAVASGNGRAVSHSLLYRMEKLRPGFEAMIEEFKEAALEQHAGRLIAAQLERSNRSEKKEDKEESKIEEWIRQIVLRKNKDGKTEFNTEALQIAAFMGGEESNE